MFLVTLFLIKIGFNFKNPFGSYIIRQQNGLAYANTTIVDLVNKSTSGDGIPDWEKILYGLDPTKKENVPGVPDNVTIEKLRAQNQTAEGTSIIKGPENLTQTDKFSRDFLATVTTLSQNGAMDQNTADAVSNSIASQIENTPPRKIFLLNDLKIVKNDLPQTIKSYNDALNIIYAKYKVTYSVTDVLQQFSADENNVDTSVLNKLDPIITQTQSVIDGMIKMIVPQYFAFLHLNILNSFEKVLENLQDIKLYDTDPIVSLSGMTKYSENANILVFNMSKLADAITQKLKP